MGWCHEFGPQIREGCGHPMRAGESACTCPQCGVVCRGRFAGCAEVWARGPREVHVVSPPGALARRTVTPVRVQGRTPAEQPSSGADQARTEVLSWLQAAFDGLRDELATTVREGRTNRMAAAAKRDSPAATEASSAVPSEALAAELREETARLQRFGDTLAESVRDAVSSALQEAQAANPPTAPAFTEVPPTPEPVAAPVAPSVTAPVASTPPEAARAEEEEAPPARPARRPPAAGGSAPAVPAALELPSGALVGPTLATAAVDALTLARVARRRRRIPSTPAPGLHRADPLLTDVLRRLERFALGRRTGTTARARTAESAGRWGIDALPLAASGDVEMAVDLRELNGVALTGAGAADVARAMAVTFFCRHHPPAEVLVIGDDVLPGVVARGLSRVPGVDDALTALGLATGEDAEDGDEQDAPSQARRASAAHLVVV